MTALDLDGVLDDPRRRLLLCLGTGGVGKTTVSATVAVRAARRGRQVLVVTIDPARRLAQAMGLELGHDPVGVPGVPGLSAMMLDTRHAFDEALAREVPPGEAAQVRANPFYTALAESFTGTQEYVAMEKVGELYRRSVADGEPDLIVVDTPPSRSALDFLDGPSRLEALAHNQLLRSLLTGVVRGPLAVVGLGLSWASAALDAVLGGRLFADLQIFLRVFERVIDGFEGRAGQTRRVLASSRAGFLVVATPRQPALGEAAGLVRRLRADALPLLGVIVNQAQPMRSRLDADPGTEPDDPAQRSVLAHHRRLVQTVLGERRAVAAAFPRELPRAWLLRRDSPVTDVESLARLAASGQEQPAP